MAILLMTRDGIRMRGEAGGASWSVPAERDAIKHRGEVVSLLAAWRVKVSFPSDGSYALSAIASGSDGLVLETRPGRLRCGGRATTWFTIGRLARRRSDRRSWVPGAQPRQ